jgi:hypothetical protein
MLKKVAIILALSVVAGLWPDAASPARSGDHRARHVAALASHAAVLVTTGRTRENGNPGHQSWAPDGTRAVAGLRAGTRLSAPIRPAGTFPPHLLSSHLRL